MLTTVLSPILVWAVWRLRQLRRSRWPALVAPWRFGLQQELGVERKRAARFRLAKAA